MNLSALTLAFALAPVSLPYSELFQATCGERWLDRAAQCKAESGFNPLAQSYIMNKQGQKVPCASGLMQFTQPTWQTAIKMGWVGPEHLPTQPGPAIRAGHAYMVYLEARTEGNWAAALGAYNAGLGSIRKAQALARDLNLEGQDAWLITLEKVTGFNRLTNKPHAEETRGYIKRIRSYRAQYRKERGE